MSEFKEREASMMMLVVDEDFVPLGRHPGVDPACSRLAHEMLRDVCGADDEDIRLLAEAFHDVWETHCQTIEDRRSEPEEETDWGGSTLRDGIREFRGGIL